MGSFVNRMLKIAHRCVCRSKLTQAWEDNFGLKFKVESLEYT